MNCGGAAQHASEREYGRLPQEGVRRLCAREDAPAWIIAPLEHGKELPDGIEMKLWRLPEPQFQLTKGDGNTIWQRIDAFGVIPCVGQEPAGLRMLKQ